jgi:hypothetical protein
MRALALIVLVGACSDLDSIETGICGNGAIDQNEDCDSTDSATCVACQLRCVDGVCPSGYGCGADGFCRAPSGVFYPTPATTFPVSEVAVSDVNGDGAGDVLGLTSTSITVLEGDPAPVPPGQPTSLFSTQYSMLTPFGRGAPVFGDFDDDHRPDVLLPTADGIAGFSSRYAVLAPHAFAFNPGGKDAAMQGFAPDLVFSFHPRFVAFLFKNTMGPGVVLGILDVESGQTGPDFASAQPACTAIESGLAINFDSYIVNDAPLQAIVALRDSKSHVCVFRVTITGPSTFAVAQLYNDTIVGGTRPVLADLDGAGCPSLVVGLNQEIKADMTSPCRLTNAITPLPTIGPVVGRVPVRSPLLGAAPDALMTPFNLFVIRNLHTAATAIYTSDRPIDVVSFGDIDGDTNIDAILGSTESNGVDVLFATATSFLLYRIATTGSVTNIATGDYDGNGVEDIVFIDRLEDERLMVSYGTRDRPLAPVENGRFTNVTAFLPVQISDSIDTQKLIRDLAVVDEPPDPDDATDTLMLLTVLHGSPQRTLVSYFDPRNGGGSNFDPTSGFFTAIAGQFSTETPKPEATDVIAIEWSRTRLDDNKVPARLYVNIGIGGGALSQTVDVTGTEPTAVWFNIGGVGEGAKCSETTFCLDRARYLALPRTPPMLDRLIGIDRAFSPTAIAIDIEKLQRTIDPNSTMTNLPTPIPALSPAAEVELVSLRRADIDGDAIVDVIAAFAGRGGAEIRACMADNFTSCPSLTELAETPGLTCIDVAPARARPRGLFDPPLEQTAADPTPLVALCDEGEGIARRRYVVRFDNAGTAFIATKLLEVSKSAAKLEVGDVNGDALDDILVLDSAGGTTVPQMQAFLQCPSSDVACREAFTFADAVVLSK